MVFAADYPFLDVFWTMLVFFFWVIWIWILITVLIDLFRRHDVGGWGKAAWALFVIVLPYLGVFQPGLVRRLRPQRQRQRADRADRQGQGAARQRRHQPGGVRAAQAQGAGLSGLTRRG
jgi:hypothetical protein